MILFLCLFSLSRHSANSFYSARGGSIRIAVRTIRRWLEDDENAAAVDLIAVTAYTRASVDGLMIDFPFFFPPDVDPEEVVKAEGGGSAGGDGADSDPLTQAVQQVCSCGVATGFEVSLWGCFRSACSGSIRCCVDM